jgi:hypothetical protein
LPALSCLDSRSDYGKERWDLLDKVAVLILQILIDADAVIYLGHGEMQTSKCGKLNLKKQAAHMHLLES